MELLPVGSQVFLCGRTDLKDGHDEALRNFVNGLKSSAVTDTICFSAFYMILKIYSILFDIYTKDSRQLI